MEVAHEGGYKYLEIFERDDNCQENMKEKVQKEYQKRVRAVLKSKLNGRNVINAIDIWAVATVWYGVGIINQNQGESDKIDRQTRKLLNMHRVLHPRSSVDSLYIPRTQGSRRLPSVKDCTEMERSNLFDYAANNNERLLKAATEELQLRTNIDGKNKEERAEQSR